jgi:hypothetical protein
MAASYCERKKKLAQWSQAVALCSAWVQGNILSKGFGVYGRMWNRYDRETCSTDSVLLIGMGGIDMATQDRSFSCIYMDFVPGTL